MSANFTRIASRGKMFVRGDVQHIGRAHRRFKGKAMNHTRNLRYAAGMTTTDPAAVLLCYCTCPDQASARQIAETLVGERLAACVNQLPGMQSTYRWQGAVTSDSEVLLLIKTTAARLPALQARLLVLHPYELPELIAVPVTSGHEAYLQWVRDGVAD